MRKILIAASTGMALLASSALVQAQQRDQDQSARSVDKKEMQGKTDMKVDMQAIYKGLRAEDVIGMTVYGDNGESIGEIENILVNTDAKATAIIVEAGGFLDIGDAHFRVPFATVNFTPFKDGVKIPITAEQADTWGLYDGDEVVWKTPREFRMTELVGDYVRLRKGSAFGYVDDVVLDRKSGNLLAVVVNGARAQGYGLYAYPFYGYPYGFDPGLNHILLPIDTPDEAKQAQKLDEKQFT